MTILVCCDGSVDARAAIEKAALDTTTAGVKQATGST